MSFRNRCIVAGANGPIHLSVPIEGGRGQTLEMQRIRIDNNEDWRSRHWKTLTACYNKSPWFEYFRDDLQLLYGRKMEWLMDWDLACMEWVCDKLSINNKLRVMAEGGEGDGLQGKADWRNKLRPSTIQQLSTYQARYPQVFEEKTGFLPGLSILDRLFCAGATL